MESGIECAQEILKKKRFFFSSAISTLRTFKLDVTSFMTKGLSLNVFLNVNHELTIHWLPT